MRRILSLVAAFAGLVALFPGPARAGGFEFSAAGARALGRGGAFHARADDPLALLFNPANLAALPGYQLSADLHVALLEACFQRSGTYSDNALMDSGTPFGSSGELPPSGYDGLDYPKVCNGAPPGFIPELAFSLRPIKELGIGIGIIAPAGIGHTRYGRSSDGTVEVDPSVNASGRLPSPARYNIVEEELILFYPSVGVGYAPHPRLRIGATFGWGIGIFDFFAYTQPYASEAFSTDIRTTLHATDMFVPRVTASVHAVPHDNFDVMVGFTWADDISASGPMELTSGAFRVDAMGQPAFVQERVRRCSDIPYDASTACTEPIRGVTASASQPWQLALGLRYAHRIRPRARDGSSVSRLTGRVEDPMANEHFDIELDVVYERNSRVDEFVVEVPEGTFILADVGLESEISPHNSVPHQWKDQVSIRLGGDYNAVPGVASIRAGISYENKGVEDAYPQMDFFPFQRIGLHAGLTIRVNRLDISVAYAHFFQEKTEVTRGPDTCVDATDLGYGQTCQGRLGATEGEVINQRGLPQVAATDALGPPHIVNEGTITSNIDVVSLGLRYNF